MARTRRDSPDGGSRSTRAHTDVVRGTSQPISGVRPAYRVPAGAGQILATSTDYTAVLARLSSLVIESGFADECIVETCSHAEPDDPRPEVPAFDAWVRSVMHAPLVARGAVIGTLAFYRFEQSTPFSEEDREIAEVLAWCAALVVDTSPFDGVTVRRARQKRGGARSGLHRRVAADDVGRRRSLRKWLRHG